MPLAASRRRGRGIAPPSCVRMSCACVAHMYVCLKIGVLGTDSRPTSLRSPETLGLSLLSLGDFTTVCNEIGVLAMPTSRNSHDFHDENCLEIN